MIYTNIWDIKKMYEVPKTYLTNLYCVEGFTSFFYEGFMYHHKVTKVYAYYKAPEGIPPTDGWPAVVIVHGGGGTAFHWMVKRWNEQGFAAISMDLEGHLPDLSLSHENRPIHNYSGPNRKNVFEDYKLPITEQWMYHAVADVIRANTLIQSFDEVNSEKVGIFGISWGGIITSIATGADRRFSFAIAVYGCGYLSESDGKLQPTTEQSVLWEPMNHLVNEIKTPMLFINGTNDQYFPLDTWARTTTDINGKVWRYIIPNFEHGHLPIFNFSEHFEFAKKIVSNKKKLQSLKTLIIEDGFLKIQELNSQDIISVIYNYTLDVGVHAERIWQQKEIGPIMNGQIKKQIKKSTTAIFINIIGRDGLCFSSEYIELI